MQTEYGYFEIWFVIAIAIAFLFLLYSSRKLVFSIATSPFLIVISLATLLIRYLGVISQKSKKRFEELCYFHLLENKNDLVDGTYAEFLNSIEASGKPSLRITFNEYELINQLKLHLSAIKEVPIELQNSIDKSSEDEKPSRLKTFKSTLFVLKNTRSQLNKMNELLKKIVEHQGQDVNRLKSLEKSENELVQVVKSLKAQEDNPLGAVAGSLNKTVFVDLALYTFFAIGFFIALFANGAVIYFPLTDIVGDEVAFADVPTAYALAVTIIVVEVVLGAIVMESLGFGEKTIYKKFSENRLLLGTVALFFLTSLAICEALLVYERDAINQSNLATEIALGLEIGDSDPSELNVLDKVGIYGQLIIAFILPFGIALLGNYLIPFLGVFRIFLQWICTGLVEFVSVFLRMIRLLAEWFRNIVQWILQLLIFHIPDIIIKLILPVKAILVAIIERLLPNIRWGSRGGDA